MSSGSLPSCFLCSSDINPLQWKGPDQQYKNHFVRIGLDCTKIVVQFLEGFFFVVVVLFCLFLLSVSIQFDDVLAVCYWGRDKPLSELEFFLLLYPENSILIIIWMNPMKPLLTHKTIILVMVKYMCSHNCKTMWSVLPKDTRTYTVKEQDLNHQPLCYWATCSTSWATTLVFWFSDQWRGWNWYTLILLQSVKIQRFSPAEGKKGLSHSVTLMTWQERSAGERWREDGCLIAISVHLFAARTLSPNNITMHNLVRSEGKTRGYQSSGSESQEKPAP